MENKSNNLNQQARRVKRVRQDVDKKQVKKWSKVWWKWLLIWMWVFVLFIIALVFFFFFYLTSNPDSAKALWMWKSTIKTITYVFAWLLFWTLFVVFLIMWLTYLYKLSTKSTDKTKILYEQ